MLYNTNKWLNKYGLRSEILSRVAVLILLFGLAVSSSSCTFVTKRLDSSTNFSQHLSQTETDIRSEDWIKAKTNLEESQKAWSKIKPVLQIDIDHDYVKNIEDDFVKLNAYLDTKDKSNSLASILLIQSTWKDIDSL